MDAGNGDRGARFFFVPVVILLAIGAGCVRHLPPESGSLDALAASARIRSQAASIDQLAIDAQVDVNKFGITWRSMNAVVLARRPGDLRLELLSPTDELLVILTVDERGFVAYERGSDVCHVGPPCAFQEARVLPLPIAAESIVDVLLGGIGLVGEVQLGALEWDERTGEYRVQARVEDEVRSLRLDPCSQELRGTRWDWSSDKGPSARVHGWQDATGASVPARVEWEIPSEGVGLDIRYRVVDRHMEFDEPAFRFPCPRGARVETHRCSDGGGG